MTFQNKKAELGKWEPCPRCGSNKVIQVRPGCLLGIIGIVTMGCMIWVVFILPIVGIIGVVVGLFFLLAAPIASIISRKKQMFMCNDCKNKWEYSKDRI